MYNLKFIYRNKNIIPPMKMQENSELFFDKVQRKFS
jgi:hypothetical protein